MPRSNLQQNQVARRLQQARQRLTTGKETIPQRPSPDMLPLSFTQERFWLLDQFDPGNPAYNRPILLRLNGELVVDALQQTLNEIIRRHDALRANFPHDRGYPKQIIHPPFDLPLTITSLNQNRPDAQDEAVQQWFETAIAQPFDLAQGPLLRAELLRFDSNHHLLLLVAHHILFDAWSARLLIRELVQLYDAFVEGRPSPLSDLSIQYADFAHWQRSRFESDQMQSNMNYWQTRLAGAPPYLELPLDYKRPEFLSHAGALYIHTFPADLVARLKSLSQSANVTLFMTLLAAFKVLLYQRSGQTDIVIGSPVAGRTHTELEPLIGVLFNTLVLRTDLSGDPTFQTLLGRIRQTALEAYTHQSLPFEKLVETLNPPRDLSRTPIFQVMFNFENLVDTVPSGQHLAVEEIEFDHHTAYYDITIELMETPNGLKGMFFYKTDLFDAATIERMGRHFESLLENIAANPDCRITTLPLLTETEWRQILVEQNSAEAIPFPDQCIHQLFEAQAEQTPDATALIFEDTHLSYSDLNRRANKLAHYLQNQGVGPDVVVGLCLERSPEMIVGLLGILKAGGAYVPLEPTYPQERLAFILDDTQAAVLLTQRHLLGRLPDYAGRVICLDDSQNDAWQQADTNPTSTVTAENLAYIIYTSGSTGQPKGVMIEHRALVNFTEMIAATYDINAFDRVLQFASISFDASAEEIYPTLTRGATLVLRTDEMLASGDIFWQHCEAWELTVLDLPTAFWHQLVSDLPKMERLFPKFIRLVILGGEKARAEALDVWLKHTPPSLRTINSYGPTEATVVATVYEISRHDNGSTVPIGRPIGNMRAYVLDEQMQPVPIGLPGELHLGGVGLARGYLNRPALTAERFIENPFITASRGAEAQRSGGDFSPLPPCPSAAPLLYKTGDLVRYRPDGNLEFLGRLDRQVKIRGFRIELGEIETLLNQHPAVEQNIVIVREDTPGDKRLVAYVVSHQLSEDSDQLSGGNNQSTGDRSLTTDYRLLITDNGSLTTDLRRHLKTYLPDYMIPSSFVRLDALPLNANGKIDRNALPAPEVTRPELVETFTPLEGVVEGKLATIWEEILKTRKVGRYDNFFELGGHSLLATQIVARIAKVFNVTLTLATFFETPTIAGLAKKIATVQQTIARQTLSNNDDELEEGEL